MIDALLDLQDVADEAQELEAPTQIPAHVDSTPRLPLTRAMAQRYEAIIQTYEQLAEMVLNTIRLEVRCRVMCNLAVRKGDIRLESEALEPDPDVVDLAGHLTDTDDLTHRALSLQDQQ
jgi:exocyst complex component 4